MDKYDKIRIVGRGAYGTVYLSRRLADKKLVIIKQIPMEQMTKDERQAALNEVKVLSMLDHPNIIKYFENFLEDKALMIVMEFAEGGTVFEYLQQRNGQLLDEEEILRLFVQMLLSLQHVHSKQILHRDLKTQNILLDRKKQAVKIGDFGISKVLSSKSKAYTVVGTPCYISPELCESKPYNQKSDIWALGCVLYELVTLKRAFEAQSLPALVMKIMKGAHNISPIADHYTDDLRQLIYGMLSQDPDRRPTINQTLCYPIILNSLMNLYTDFGKIACRRVVRPLSGISGAVRNSTMPKSQGSTAELQQQSQLVGQQSSKQTAARCCVYCWGSDILTPTPLSLPSSDACVLMVAAGRMQKAAVTKNSRLLMWETATNAEVLSTGLFGMTQLKSGDSGNSSVSSLVSQGTKDRTLSQNNESSDSVSLNSSNTCTGSEEGVVVGAQSCTVPGLIPRYMEGQSAVSIHHVSCGDLFTACLTDRGILMTFGSGASGCLGHGNYADVTQAKIVEALLGCEVTEVSCGASHIIAITNEYEVFAWGRTSNGRLGLSSTSSSLCSPSLVPLDTSDWSPYKAFCGVDCSVLLTRQKKILCTGSNRFNKLSLDREDVTVDEVQCFTPVTSRPIGQLDVRTVSLGLSHTAIVTELGECYTFGGNQFKQLGHSRGQISEDRTAHKVVNLDLFNITQVACGDTFTVAVSKDGRVFTWGKGSRGRLGRSNIDPDLPVPVTFSDSEGFEVVSLACSHGTTLLATRSRTHE